MRHFPSVWVFTREFSPMTIGGLGTVATELSHALRRSNVRVTVFTGSSTRSINRSTNGGISIVRIPSIPAYYDHATRTYKSLPTSHLAQRLSLHKPNAIHIHSVEFANAAIHLSATLKIPLIYTCHSLIIAEQKNHPNAYLQKLLLRHSSLVIAPSQWLRREIHKHYPFAAHKIRVIPNGVTMVSASTKASPTRLLYVGRLVRDKGIEEMIDAFALLSPKHRQARLTIIGKGSPGFVRRLKHAAKLKRVGDQITWYGFLPHEKVKRLYRNFGAMIVPSKRESFCLVALEAMAHGVPLVSTRAGGMRDFVNRSNASIIPYVAKIPISRAVHSMWSNRKLTRRRMLNAKQTARRYGWGNIALRYKRTIMQLIGNKGRDHERRNR